ncbi:MAG: hypothetical protein ACKOQS_25235 [Dolichospermum sp.]|jgi:hypothetical protein
MKPNNFLISLIVASAFFGVFFIAIFDEGTRPVFVDLAKFILGAYIGYWIPSPRQ